MGALVVRAASAFWLLGLKLGQWIDAVGTFRKHDAFGA